MNEPASSGRRNAFNGRWPDRRLDRGAGPGSGHDGPGGAEWLAPPAPEEGLRHYAGIIRNRWPLVVACLVACVAATAIYVVLAPRTYRAQASILVTPVDGTDQNLLGLGLIPGSSDPTRDVSTAASFVTDRGVSRRVAARLGGSAAALGDSVEAVPVAQSNLVAITASAATARRARDVANGFAAATVAERTARLQQRLGTILPALRQRVAALPATSGGGGLRARLATLESLVGQADPTVGTEIPATLPSAPASPRPKLALVAGVLAGLIIGVGAAFALAAFDPKVRREDALRRIFRLPVLARIRRQRRTGQGPLTPGTISPAGYQDYRMLRASLDVHHGAAGARSVLLTSAGSAEGKSTTALNLAAVLAHEGNRVILLEGDVRRPSLGGALGVPPKHGVVSVLLGDVELEDALMAFDDLPRNLRALLVEESGPYVADTPLMKRFGDVIDRAAELADYVVVDAPPIPEVSDALPLFQHVDDVLIVVRLGRTRNDRLEELGEILALRGVRPVGMVLVGDERRGDSGYYGPPPKAGPPVQAPAAAR